MTKDNQVFILYQTDIHKTKKSRVCFGVFDTEVKAVENAKVNDLYTHESEVEIVEVTINKFEEI